MAREKDAPATEAHKRWQPRFQTMNRDGSIQLRIGRNARGKNHLYEDEGMKTDEGPEKLTLSCDLSGAYQQENIITAYTAIEELQGLGWTISPEHIASGLASISTSTGLMGRWQTIGHNPRSICDTAHNQNGIAAITRQIMQTPWKKLHMVWGMVDDKELADILPLLPTEATYYFTSSSVPRSLDPGLLAKQAAEHKLKGMAFSSVQEAYQAAEREAGQDDMIFTGGSTFVVADLLLMKF
jgi:dihydrofolate synthase/folylpolyglutamate synthase